MNKVHYEIPIRCQGIAAVLLKKIDNEYNDEVLEHIYKHFVKRSPSEWLLIRRS